MCLSKARNNTIGYYTVISKKMKMTLPTTLSKKTHIYLILSEKRKIMWKKPQMILRNYILRFHRAGERRKACLGACGFFLLEITTYKIIPDLFKKIHLTMAVFLKYMIILELGEIPCFNDFINVLMICLN